MFDTPTVLVLGAGCSAPFGLPTGQQLRQNILTGIKSILAERDPWLTGGNLTARGLVKNAYNGFWRHLQQCASDRRLPQDLHLTPGTLQEFRKELAGDGEPSIDRFLRDRPKFAALGRCLIVLEICKSLITLDEDDVPCLKDFAHPGEENWIWKLIEKLRAPHAGVQDIEKNQLKIITFNYDPILEIVLSQKLTDAEVFRDSNWKEALKIHHVHGFIPFHENINTNVGNFILEVAPQISLITGEAPETRQQGLESPLEWLNNAKQIIFAGFAFDDYNTRLLKLNTRTRKNSMFCHNFDGNLGVARRIRELGIPDRNVMTGRADAKLTLMNAMNHGILENVAPQGSYLETDPLLVLPT